MQALGLVMGVVGAIWLWRVGMEAAQRHFATDNPVRNAAAVGTGLIAFVAMVAVALSPAYLH